MRGPPRSRAGFRPGTFSSARPNTAQRLTGCPVLGGSSAHARSAPVLGRVMDAPYGVKTLPELYKEWASSGMIANIGTRLVEVGSGTLVLEGNMTAEAHGFPTGRGPIIHGGAIATLADEALASVAFTLAEPGETTATADLRSTTSGPASRDT